MQIAETPSESLSTTMVWLKANPADEREALQEGFAYLIVALQGVDKLNNPLVIVLSALGRTTKKELLGQTNWYNKAQRES